MQQGLLHLHNLLRWIVLLFLVLTLIRSLGGMSGGKVFGKSDKRTALFLMISCDIQLVLGLVLYFMKGWMTVLASGADAMSDPYKRFFAVEHMVGMLIAIILVHIGYSATKKSIPDASKFKKLFWFTLAALILVLAMIPWPGREVGRPMFPGM